MKRNLFFVLMILCAIPLFSSFEIFDTNEVNSQQDKINLTRLGGTTRSTDIVVNATTDSQTTIAVSVTGFTGTAVVQIVGGRTSAQYYFDVNEMGYEVINIGTLRPATYTLRIILDTEIYEGTFVKEYVVR